MGSKKILIIAYDLNPNIGTEAGVSFIWSEIIAEQYDVVVYTQAFHKADVDRHGTNLKIRYFEPTPFLSKFLTRLHLYNIDFSLFVRKVKKVIETDIDPGNTLIHFLSPFGIHSFNSMADSVGLPYVIGPVGGYLKMPPGFGAYRKLPMILKEAFYSRLLANPKWQRYFERAQAIICGTELVAAHLPTDAKNNVNIIYDSTVDTDFFAPDCSIERKKSGCVTIVFTGRLVLYKGVFLLLHAFEKLVSASENVRLIYAGDGKERAALEAYVSSHNLSASVSFTGRINRDQLKQLLLDSDIYCLPTLKDPGGNAVFEAMACGLPIVTSNYGGPAYSVSRDSAILIDPISIDDYIEKLFEALKILVEREDLRYKMGVAARAHVLSMYSAVALKEKIISFYNKYYPA